jgi:ferritin heavy chain
MSRARQDWHKDCEDSLNVQINKEIAASATYQAMWAYFARDDVGLENIAAFFKQESNDEREHSQKLIDYQILRGGKVAFTAIAPPPGEFPATEAKSDALVAFEAALALEKEVNTSLKGLHAIGTTHNDVTYCGYLESEFLTHQLESQRELALIISKLVRIGSDAQALLAFDSALNKSSH